MSDRICAWCNAPARAAEIALPDAGFSFCSLDCAHEYLVAAHPYAGAPQYEITAAGRVAVRLARLDERARPA